MWWCDVYRSIRCAISSFDYIAVHRTFPGIPKITTPCLSSPSVDPNIGPTYDPPNRSWFRGTSSGDGQLYAYAYKETFTGSLVINFSVRKTNYPYTVVGASVMELSAIAPLIAGAPFLSNGFAALVSAHKGGANNKEHEVYIYGSGAATYRTDVTPNRFRYLSEIDPGLELVESTASSSDDESGGSSTTPTPTVPTGRIVEYTKNGETYYVAQIPILHDELYLFLYCRRADAFVTFDTLQANVGSTTDDVSMLVVIICVVTLCVVSLSAIYLTQSITRPLILIRSVAQHVTSISANEIRPFDEPLKRMLDGGDTSTSHELASLSANFTRVVSRLNDIEILKRNRPKYPQNPLYGKANALCPNPKPFATAHTPHHQPTIASIPPSYAAVGTPPADAAIAPPPAYDAADTPRVNDQKIDPIQFAPAPSTVGLGATYAIIPPNRAAPPPNFGAADGPNAPPPAAMMYAPLEIEEAKAVQIGGAARKPSPPKMIAVQAKGTGAGAASSNPKVAALTSRSGSCWSCCSLPVQLRYPITVLLVLGLVLAMVIPVLLLSRESDRWMDGTTELIVASTRENNARIATNKAQFVSSFYEQTIIDLSVVNKMVTAILDASNYTGAAAYLYDASGHPSADAIAIAPTDFHARFKTSYSLDALSPFAGTTTSIWGGISINDVSTTHFS